MTEIKNGLDRIVNDPKRDISKDTGIEELKKVAKEAEEQGVGFFWNHATKTVDAIKKI